MGQGDFFAKRRQLRGERPVGIERERCAFKHELVLSADLVDVEQRQVRLNHPRDRDVEALVDDAAAVGRTVRHQQNFAAGLGDALDRVRPPDVLADRNADANTAKNHRTRCGAWGEHPLLVEHAVVRQIDLEAQGGDATALDQRRRVVELAVLKPGSAE